MHMVLIKLLKKLDSEHLKFSYVRSSRLVLFFFVKLSCLLFDTILFFPLKANRICKAKIAHRIKGINSPSSLGFTSCFSVFTDTSSPFLMPPGLLASAPASFQSTYHTAARVNFSKCRSDYATYLLISVQRPLIGFQINFTHSNITYKALNECYSVIWISLSPQRPWLILPAGSHLHAISGSLMFRSLSSRSLFLPTHAFPGSPIL